MIIATGMNRTKEMITPLNAASPGPCGLISQFRRKIPPFRTMVDEIYGCSREGGLPCPADVLSDYEPSRIEYDGYPSDVVNDLSGIVRQ